MSDAERIEAPQKVEKHSYKIWAIRVSKAKKIEKEDPPYQLNLYVFGLGKNQSNRFLQTSTLTKYLYKRFWRTLRKSIRRTAPRKREANLSGKYPFGSFSW